MQVNDSLFSYRLPIVSHIGSIEIGALKSVSELWALGGTAVVGAADGGAVFGAKARYRRWLSPIGIAMDVGAGLESGPALNRVAGGRALGFTSDVAINFKDYVSVAARQDILRIDGRIKPVLSLGVRAGSKPSLFVVGGTLLTVGTFAALLSFYDCGNC